MKKIVNAIISIAIATAITISASAYDVYFMTDLNNIREKKSVSSKIIDTLPTGVSVFDMLNDDNSDWIRPKGYNGFVHKNYCAEDNLKKYSFYVARIGTDIFRSAKLIEPVAHVNTNSAVWVTGDFFLKNQKWVAPCKTTIGNETIRGFISTVDFLECDNYLAKIKNKNTKMFKDDITEKTIKTVSSGSYWVIDHNVRYGRIRAMYKGSDGFLHECYFNANDVSLVYINP